MVEKKETVSALPLDVELLQVGDYLFGRIKNQHDTLRNVGINFEHEGIRILSGGSGGAPQLYKDNCKCTTFYIRGTNKAYDHTTFMVKYANEKEADKWAKKLVAAIEEFNKDPLNTPVVPTEPLRCKRILG